MHFCVSSLSYPLFGFQAKDTEKRLYGIDDIKDAAEVIIVITLAPYLDCYSEVF